MVESQPHQVRDKFNRPIRDLRISVTDRCNFRCVYCMPREVFGPGYAFVPRSELLRLEEIHRVARIFVQEGVTKIRITGGEPLIRRDLEQLIEMISGIDGIRDLSMTTNASMLTLERARSLYGAGLARINISLDALDQETFQEINDVKFPVSDVLSGIDNALATGFSNVKINSVIRKGSNDHSILDLARHFRGSGATLRFIEFMDVGSTNQWQREQVMPASKMIDIIKTEFPIAPVSPNYEGEVAKRWRYLDGSGEIGFITSVTQPFCRDCSRARISAVGKIYTCLFASNGHDLKDLIREGASDAVLARFVREIWSNRIDRYSELRSDASLTRDSAARIEMSYIGG
ncbi:MAG: GTP 3',8-cyclase MoaA [Acidiferrobacteraceae bacterium]|nr:GTP 3',8-cyclase MoaA [Acidiferrobacteraceae bacterium]